MSGVGEFVNQEYFDEVLKEVLKVVNSEDLYMLLIADYDHDTVYSNHVGEGVEMLTYRLKGCDHYNHYYVKPKWYAFKVIKAKIKRLIERWRS